MQMVDAARLDLTRRILDWQDEQEELTTWEVLKILSDVLSSKIGNIAKYEIRYERHGNYEKKGDEA